MAEKRLQVKRLVFDGVEEPWVRLTEVKQLQRERDCLDTLRSKLGEEVEQLRDESNSFGRYSQHQANLLRAVADRLSKLLSEEGRG